MVSAISLHPRRRNPEPLTLTPYFTHSVQHHRFSVPPSDIMEEEISSVLGFITTHQLDENINAQCPSPFDDGEKLSAEPVGLTFDVELHPAEVAKDEQRERERDDEYSQPGMRIKVSKAVVAQRP